MVAEYDRPEKLHGFHVVHEPTAEVRRRGAYRQRQRPVALETWPAQEPVLLDPALVLARRPRRQLGQAPADEVVADRLDGAAGEKIPVPARILAVSERFEVLTAGRGCTRATPQEALDQIVAGSGSEFDPLVIEALGRATREGGLELNLPDLALPATVAVTA